MALGKRKRERQLDAFVASSDLPQSPGQPFYTALNRLLASRLIRRLGFASQHCMAMCGLSVVGRVPQAWPHRSDSRPFVGLQHAQAASQGGLPLP